MGNFGARAMMLANAKAWRAQAAIFHGTAAESSCLARAEAFEECAQMLGAA